MTTLRIIAPRDRDYATQVDAVRDLLRKGGLRAAGEQDGLDVPQIVADIIAQVRADGDTAVASLVSKLDRADVSPAELRVSQRELDEAHAAAEPAFLELVRAAISNIREYQRHILQTSPAPLHRGGRELGVRYTPIERVGVYVPGGQALYPSTVLMTVVPAQVAGVDDIAIATPPTGGSISPMALALARELGISEVYRAGGAVGIAALALGTERIRRVHKIVGPGNAFVAEAKRQLFGHVAIDSIAGPSEVLIVADDSADPRWVAADMLAQAEHNPGSALLVTPSLALAEAVAEAIDCQLGELDREDVTRPSLERYAAAIVVGDLEAACDLANDFATEHLQIITSEDAQCLERIRHAGAIFVGAHTPVPLGDYFAGPSHVLPTGGTAKFFGPLSCNDFLKASSVVRYDARSLAEDAKQVGMFARREGLDAHARAVEIRQPSQKA